MEEPIRQADALWLDYTLENYAAINSTWDANWTGIFEISATETSTPVYTGSLTRSTVPGVFQLRLLTDSASTAPVLAWSAVPAGTYKLMAQFTNSTTKYREEFIEALVIKAQGIS